MLTEARGQLLGYTLQFPRALLRLLELSPNGAVGIEIMGDVSVFSPEGNITLEEDKSSICSNPLTDKSSNLWKTFFNWCKLIQENNDIKIDNTRFILYTNHSVTEDSIVKRMNDAQTQTSISDLKEDINRIYREISQSHVSYQYLHYLLNDGLNTFREVIMRFELVSHDNTEELSKELYDAIKAKMVPDTCIKFIYEHLSGWLQNTIVTKIAKEKKPIITFSEFSHVFLSLFQDVRTKKLIDFAIDKLPSNAILQKEAQNRPVYVQQLQIIDLDSSDIIEAISDFLRAKTNRQEWIEREIVDEKSMKDFQERLLSFHSAERKCVLTAYKNYSLEEQGAMIYFSCKKRGETINEMTPPDRTISGTYHFLADQRIIGWHPNWEKIIKKEEQSQDEESR
jgi:hypothetical protein